MTSNDNSWAMDHDLSVIYMDEGISFRSLPLGLRKLLKASNHLRRRIASLFRRYSISNF